MEPQSTRIDRQQRYPSRPLTMRIPYGREGVSSALGVLLAEKLSARIGQPIAVDFRPGDWGNVGAALSAKATPDGYTLHFGNMTHMVYNRFRYATMPFDAIADFEPVICTNARIVILVVHPALPVRNVSDLVALARDRPLRAGVDEHAGFGGICHLLTEKLRIAGGIPVQLEARGVGEPVIRRVVSGDIDFMFTNEPPVREALKANELRAIAIASALRSPLMPELPTTAEQGFAELTGSGWHGVFVPKHTPRNIVEYLANEMREVMLDTAVRTLFQELGADAVGITGEDFATFLRSEIDRWPSFVADHHIKTE